MDDATIWQAALGELQLQMTVATFDTWLRGARFVKYDDEAQAFVVEVKNGYAKDWLDNRLRPTIERTLVRLAGRPCGIRFEIEEVVQRDKEADEEGDLQSGAPAGVRFRVPDYDVHGAGFFMMAGYESTFWAPYLGRIAWRVIEVMRETDHRGTKRTEWTPARRWTAPSLAELVPCGRQAIVGVNRKCDADDAGAFAYNGGWCYHQPGAFDRLQAAGVATVERRGDPPHVTYWVSVRTQLKLLEPAQVLALAARLQEKHDRWLADHGFDPRQWDI